MDLRPAGPVELVPPPPEPPADGPKPFLCAADAPALPSLVACTSPGARFEGGDRWRLDALLDGARRERRVLLRGVASPRAALVVFGEGFGATCVTLYRCDMRFGAAAGRATATATVRPEALARWREVRDAVDGLLRAATGHGLADAPTLLQPEGEVFPPPRP